ncbi:MAG: hypothetical protein FJZ87_05960 [Chloroflexi bacterium]|nr:hypothetical protein [Chloroflexota bacterium]
MSSSKSSPQFSVKPEDWSIWSQQLQSETDRGLATTAAAILDHLVARRIESFILDDSIATKRLLGNPFSPLGSFAARTAAAYSLGLITDDERDDLDCIRDIRNDFAHQPTSPSFTDQSIAQKVRNLKTPKLMSKIILDPYAIPPRELFRDSVSMLSTFIDIRTRNNSERRTSPKRFKIVSTKRPA